jgi:hypothetical protein
MEDSRSRPQYGEYASPEDQAKAIRVPIRPPEQQDLPPATQHAVHAPIETPSADQGVADHGVTDHDVTGGSPWLRPGQRESPSAGGSADVARRMAGPRDIGFTVALLAIGLFWVIVSIPGMANLPATIQQTYAMQGYTGKYGPVALGTSIGLAINISQLVLWAITCGLSVLAIRRRRRAFYIPLIGAVLSGLVVMVLTVVAMLNDPGLLQYLSTLG